MTVALVIGIVVVVVGAIVALARGGRVHRDPIDDLIRANRATARPGMELPDDRIRR